LRAGAGVVALGLGLGAAGCDAVDAGRSGEPAARTGALVRVDVSYTHEAGSPATAIRYDAQAHFARFRPAGATRVPTLLGLSHAADEALPLGGCRVADPTVELDSALASRAPDPVQVTLLDAGRLEVRGAPLVATHVPELVPFVSGVVYGVAEGGSRAPALQLGQPYGVTAAGADEIGPLAAAVTAPRAWPAIVVAPTLRRGADLEVRWATEPAAVSAAPTTEALVEVRWTTPTGSRAVHCRTADDGVHVVPQALLGSLRPGATAEVAISRVARAPLVAPGLGRGELVLSLRDVATTLITDEQSPTP